MFGSPKVTKTIVVPAASEIKDNQMFGGDDDIFSDLGPVVKTVAKKVIKKKPATAASVAVAATTAATGDAATDATAASQDKKRVVKKAPKASSASSLADGDDIFADLDDPIFKPEVSTKQSTGARPTSPVTGPMATDDDLFGAKSGVSRPRTESILSVDLFGDKAPKEQGAALLS